MSLPKFFSKQFREEMLCHPVWLPGEGIVPGDIGVMRDGIFMREGNFSDYTAVTANIVEEEIPVSSKSKFSVGVTVSLGLGAEAKIDPNAKIGGKLSIRRGGGVVLHIPNQRRRYISNLREVLRALPWGGKDFGEDTVLVSEVRLAKAIALVLSETGDTSVDLTGKAVALQALDIADASISFGATSAASYTTSIGDPQGQAFYPYGLLLYKARTGFFQDGKVVPLEAAPGTDADMAPFEEVSPYDEEL
ncbi:MULTISPECIES: hypothetical protein [unclassified Bradyrhizobium]|uniref:hypothetical protein n=1 Tax=unclassified Bradyrhizobium TaxID=2631580 RepID=UPI0028E4F8F0|nr:MULTISPECIES: hypothetical protein [unclassified Bradyrhizobium]